jgi:phospholipid/cholesterol/gamma-HCH transport system ATP-binding protein
MASLIQIRGLKKAFGNHAVLANLDLDLVEGQNLVLLGLSGSGKTVLMKCILGLIRPDAGSIRIGGQEVVGSPPAERFTRIGKIGVLYQNGALFDSLPVWQNIAFSMLNIERIGELRARDAAIEVLAKVGLRDDVADLWPADLSGGMRKRVALARALIGDPAIVFLDDPTAGLDPVLTAIIDSLMATSLRQLSATALTITHDLQSAGRIAQRAAFLADGRILWEGSMDTLAVCDEKQVEDFLRASNPHRGSRS